MKTAGNVLDGALDVGKDLLTFFLGKRFKWLGKLGKKVGKQVTNWVTKGFKKLSKLF